MDSSTQMRAIIFVCVTDLPGEPLRRHTTLGEIFCSEVLHRPLNTQLHPSGYDGMIILEGFDSDKPVRRWFIYDLNVKGPLSQEELVAMIPHKVFLASRECGKWTFISRDMWNESAKSRCKGYVWGGRREQEVVAAMRDAEQKL